MRQLGWHMSCRGPVELRTLHWMIMKLGLIDLITVIIGIVQLRDQEVFSFQQLFRMKSHYAGSSSRVYFFP